MGYVGFQALVFYELMLYGTEETYEKNRKHLHKCYSYLRAKLPVMYDKEGKREVYNKDIAPLLDDVASQTNIARELYRSTFEGIHTWTEDEKEFDAAMDGIFERLSVIAAVSGMIDKEKMDEMEMTF